MTLSPTWIGLFEWSATICELAGHWFVQSTLLIAAGLLAGRLFANRGPAFASAIYRTTLVAAFLCPIVTWCLAQFGMTLGITALPELRVAAVELVAVTRMVEAPAAAPPVRTTPSAPREPAIAPLHGNDVASSAPDAMMSARGGMPAPERMPEAPVMAAVAQGPDAGAPEPASAETAAAPEPFASAAPTVELVEVVEMVPTTVLRPWTALLVGFLAVSWLMITALFLLRVVFAHIHLLSLRRAAHPAPAEQQQICWQVAEKLGVWPPVVLTSPFVAGPCLAGVIRPAILLPDELPELPLATVFVHELAHLRRRDCLWNVVRQVVCAVLFFQPLAWRLSRRLEVSAEEVCDDHVVEHGADRGTYADILVSLAERTLLPASSAVVPLVTFRSLLGRRVARILDRTRRLSLSISLTALALILAGGLAATLGTGVLGPAGRGVPAGAEANEKSESIAAGERESATTSSDREADAAKADVATTTDGPATAAGAPTDDVELHYRGRVVDTDDKPVAGAKIFFHYWLQGAAPRGDLSPLAVTDADGAFDFSTKTSDFDPLSDNSRYLCGIVATAEGYGFAHGWSIAFETTGEARKHLPQQVLDHMKNYLQRDQLDEPPVLQLVRDDAPLVGQVVSIEGKPVPGARVRLHDVMLQDAAKGTANLDGWEQEARDPKARFYTLRNNHVPVEINTWQLPSIVHDVTADAEGRFTMRGVGRERVAELMISGPDIETSLVKTRTRGGEVLRIGGFRERGMGRIEASDTVYPHKFTFAAGPSKPITGRITDAETGAPIAGVRVSLGQVGTFMSFGKHDITSMTDADGRYRLEGLALDDSESIIVWPAAKSGYVPTGAPVKLALDKPAPEKDFQIRHGVWLRGQATDKATGRPIPGRVQYFARSNNPHLKSYPGLARSRISYEARSDAAGRFEMPIPPGPGIVTYMAMDHTRYRRGQGAELVSDGTGIGGTFAGKTYKTVPSMLIDSNEIILREINPSEGDQQVEVMLPIESGLDVYGKIVDAQGKPVVGGLVGNAVFNGAWYTHPIRDNTFHVEGYYPDQPRDLFFYNPERDLAGHYLLAGPPPENLVVQLAPAGAIRGRLVDKQGGALSRVELSGQGVPTTREKPELFLTTDDDGNFLIRGLIPGRKYTVEGQGGENYGQLFADLTVEAGETKDVGDVTLTRPEPKKSTTAAGAKTNGLQSAAAAALFGGKAAQPRGDTVILPPSAANKQPTAGATGGFSNTGATGGFSNTGATGGFSNTGVPGGSSTSAANGQATGRFSGGSKPAMKAMTAQPVSGEPATDTNRAAGTFIPASAVPADKRGPEPVGDTIRVTGRVVDPSGQAAAGADVMVAGYYWRSSSKREPIARAKTDAAGHFEIEYRKSQLPELGESRGWQYANIVAWKPGFGPAWISYEDVKPGEETTLRLAKEEAIEGRIVDLEGKPIRGVQVELLNLRANQTDDLSNWLDRMREYAKESASRTSNWVFLAGSQRKTESTPEREATPNKTLNADVAALALKSETDVDGRFRLDGVGHDRLAALRLSGAGIVIATVNVVSRPMEKIASAGIGISDSSLYGARFEYAAEPSQPIEGVIRDAKTHEPIPRVRVVSDTFAGTGVGGVHSLETVADDEGRYRLVGMPKGEGNKIVAVPGDDQPYFMCDFHAPTGDGLAPVKFDMELHRGLWISGRVTNAATGGPVSGHVYYVPWPDNPHVQNLPEFQRTVLPGLQFYRHATDAEGNYRLVGMPGRGLVTVRVNDDHPYPQGQGLRAIEDLPGANAFSRVGALLPPTKSSPTAGVEVRPTEKDKEVTANISLVDGIRVSLAITDPEGQPLDGVTARGLWPDEQVHEENDAGPTVEVRALWPDEQRRVFLHHDERRLGKALLVRASETGNEPIKVQLEPCATIAMRLVDGEGQPVPAVVRFEAVGERGQGLYWESTDKDGRLTNTMVPAGCDYELHCQSPRGEFVTIAEGVSVAPGETIDLGEIDITKSERPEITRKPATAGLNASSAVGAAPTTGATGGLSTSAAGNGQTPPKAAVKPVITGQVLDPDGRPVQGADVAVQGQRWDWFQARGKPDVTKTDAQGNFRIEVSDEQYGKGDSSDWSKRARIVASADGFGMAGVKYSALGAERHAVIRLVPDEPIEGRIVDLEGHPVAGAKVDIFSITTNEKQDLTPWVTALREGVPFHNSEANGQPHFELTTDKESARFANTAQYTTDADGRFRITGIGRDRFVNLKLAGGGVVATDLRLVTLPIATFNMKWYADDKPAPEPIYGAKFQFIAEPSPPIEGVVRDAKTGEPLPGMRVWSESFSGHKVSGDFRLQTVSDSTGHYRLEGMPRGTGNRIAAIPNDEQPYFMREFDVPNSERLEAVQCDLELHRGVLITGRVTAKDTGAPAGGRLFYLPHPDNPHMADLPEFNSHRLPGPQWRYETDEEGNYCIVGLPGRGYLMLSMISDAPTNMPAPAQQGLEQITNLPKREAFYKTTYMLSPHDDSNLAVRELDIGDNDARVAVDFEISSGERVPLRLVDPANQAIAGAEAYGLWPRYHWHIDRDLPAAFDVLGLRPEEKRRVLLYHKERNLGCALVVCKQDAGEAAVTARLIPCATVTGRLLGKDGQPLAFNKLDLRIAGERNHTPEFPTGVTDKEGRFTVTNLPTGCAWDISVNEHNRLVQFAEKVEPQPGETIDLGEIDTTSDKRPAIKRTPMVAAATAGAATSAATGALPGGTSGPSTSVTTDDRVPPPAEAPAAAASGPESHLVRGRVIGPKDEPIAGARVISRLSRGNTRTDADGRFEIAIQRPRPAGSSETKAKPWKAYLQAAASGYGMAYAVADAGHTAEPLMIKLVPDEPIEGRVIDLEGLPIAGLQLRLEALAFSEAEDPAAWIDQLRTGPISQAPLLTIYRRDLPLSTEVTTDDDGRFRLEGLGRDRLATLQLSGARMAAQSIHVVTRAMEPIRVDGAGVTHNRTEAYYGAKFQYVAEPSQTIEGIVRDAKSGQPIAGAHVYSQKFAGEPNGANARKVGALADRDGRYRLEGMPRGKGNRVIVVPPKDEPYFVREFDVPTANDFAPVKLDLELRRGVWISGRVTLEQTGAAARARIYYLPWPDNPTIKDWPEFHERVLADSYEGHMNDEDGRYRIVGLPGRGLVEVLVASNVPVPSGQGIDAIKDLPSNEEFQEISQLYVPRSQNVTAVKDVTIRAGQEVATVDFVLAGGKWLAVDLVDTADQPVSGATVWWGLAPRRVENAKSRVEVVGLAPNEDRWAMAYHAARNLGKAQQVTWKNDWPGPAKLVLEPCSTVQGRLLTKDGEPLRGAKIECDVSMKRTSGHTLEPAMTDEQGRFVVRGVLPGGTYRIFATDQSAKTYFLADSLSVAAGETIDLGEIDISKKERPAVKRTATTGAIAQGSTPRTEPVPLAFVITESSNDEKQAGNATADNSKVSATKAADTDDTAHVRGRIVNTDGQPIAGADVAIIALRIAPEVGGFIGQKAEVPAQGKSDAEGRFAFSFPKLSSKTHRQAHLIARASGLGLGYATFKPDDGQLEVELKLSPEEKVRGRVVNVDGQPGAGVAMKLQAIMPRSGDERWTDAVSFFQAETYPAAWPTLSATDAEGRFEIHGVPQGHGIHLDVPGTEQFAPQNVTLNSGQAEERSKNDATYRSLVKNVKPGEEIVLALAPAQWFEGTVRYADTGEPAPHAKVSIWASQQQFGSMSTVKGETDDQGHYRINPHSGIRFGVNAFGPAHTPYLNYKTRLEEAIQWQSGERVRKVDVKLARGVIVRGTIVEADTGKPIAGAAVQYIPESENNRNVSDSSAKFGGLI